MQHSGSDALLGLPERDTKLLHDGSPVASEGGFGPREEPGFERERSKKENREGVAPRHP